MKNCNNRMMMAKLQRVCLALFIGGLAVCALLTPRVGADDAPYKDFPLDKDVPGRSHAILDEGMLPDHTRWGAYASRVGRRSGARWHPCVSVARITRAGEYGHAAACGPLSPSGDRRDVPVNASISGAYNERPDGPVTGEWIGAMSFDRTIRKVQLAFSDGGSVVRPTKMLNAYQRSKVHLVKFSYIAVALQRDVCVEEIIGYDSRGVSVLEAGTELC
jgi:hypothetical protein